jgi:hypothetical protein
VVTTRHARRRGLIAALVSVLLVATGLLTAPPAPAQAVTGNQFQAGYIISDQYFYDANAMTQAQIQAFLNSQIGTCSNSLCLNVLTTSVTARAARYSPSGVLICKPYDVPGGSGVEAASTIIFKVQQACGISAKVLLVTLQKEQGLVTKKAPTLGTLERAMGYGCPDSAGGACASDYYGFFNQMYSAAWQLRRYSTAPVWGSFQPGWETIQYHPEPACGSSQVFIANNATAALYNYTPYQPNGPSLNNLGGTGDGCSTYGNRNFWVYYNNWFGNTTLPPGSPEGELSTVTADYTGVHLEGFGVDPDAPTATVLVSVQFGPTWYAFRADQQGADLTPKYPGAGNMHKFTAAIPAAPGAYPMCIYLINAGGAGSTLSLGCSVATVPPPPTPRGAIETATASNGVITFSGWAVRPDTPTSPVPVAINAGAQWIGATANQPNSSAPTVVPGAGPNQGFSGSFTAPPGLSTFCLWAGPAGRAAVAIACRSVVVPDAQKAVAAIETATATSSAITMTGWVAWPNAPTTPVNLAINIGSAWHAVVADQPSTTAQAAVPGTGPNHGFTFTLPAAPGVYPVCLWTTEPAGGASMVGCRNISVASSAPTTQGVVETMAPAAGSVNVSGWAVWTDKPTTAVPLAVQIDNSWFALIANQPSTTVQGSVPGVGANHGYAASYPLTPGAHQVCVWAVQSAGGAKLIECRTITPTAGIPTLGEVTTVSGGIGGIHFDGWAAMPGNPAAPVSLAANVGGAWVPYVTGRPNALAPTRLTGAGPNQGFSGLFEAAPGTHSICIWSGGATGAVNLGCRTVTVTPTPLVAGELTTATPQAGGIALTGWAVWPSTPTVPITVAANVGTTWVELPAAASPTLSDFVKGAGTNQGYAGTIAAPSGQNTVCIWVVHPSGPAVQVGCQTVTVP